MKPETKGNIAIVVFCMILIAFVFCAVKNPRFIQAVKVPMNPTNNSVPAKNY